jgi:hypothetical protein
MAAAASRRLRVLRLGVPRRIVLDNLRAAIVHAALYALEVQRSYRECAEHYGFLIAPCWPRTPEPGRSTKAASTTSSATPGQAVPTATTTPIDLLGCASSRRPSPPRHHQANPPRRIRSPRAPGVVPAAAAHALGARRVEPGQAPRRLPRRLRWAHYSAHHRLLGEWLWVRAAGSKIDLSHDYALVATPRSPRPAPHARRPPAPENFLLKTPVKADVGCPENTAVRCPLFTDVRVP